ncbi:MAG TPA: hypothetical protein VEQ34_09375, partial [Pyrinomonadaceae bacterium]|nr:hypothetical protein [Pyrinomonadaceae bacterium]
MRKAFLLFAAFLSNALSVHSQETAPMPSFTPEIRRVAVFKNGYAFTYREGQAATNNGWAYTTRTPIGVLGTVWGYTTAPNVRVVQLLASEGERDQAERVTNIAEFLLANEGARIKVSPHFLENDKFFAGTYELLKPNDAAVLAQTRNTNYGYPYAMNALNELTIALKTENGTMVFPASVIKTVEVIGDAKNSLMRKSNRLAVRVEGAKNGQTVGLGVAALERGIRWIPAYRVEVKGEPIKEAKLELEAMLINELADLNNSEIYFVVGAPSFLFQETMSPLSMNTAFAGVSSYFQTGGRGGRDAYANAISTQAKTVGDSSYRQASEDPAPTLQNEEQLSSLSAEQLFLYKADQIALKKGERASLRLFSLTVPASEICEWTISDPPQTGNEYSNSSNQQPRIQDLSSGIWYALKLKNQTGMPWTTAPA